MTYTGPDALGLEPVVFDVAIDNNTDLLAEQLEVVIDRVDDCTARNFASSVVTDRLAELAGAKNSTDWTPAEDGEVQSFLFTVTVGDSLDDNAVGMGDTVTGVDLIWSVTTTS